MPEFQYPIPTLDGGLNNKFEPYIIGDNESPDCLNAYSNNLGGVQTRYGSTKLNTTPVGSFACDGLFTARYGNGVNQTMLGWWGGSLFQLVGASTFTTVPSAQSVFSAGMPVDMVVYQDICFFGYGGTPYKWNGADFTRHGIAQPNSTPGVATTSAGVVSGTYQYKVLYVNSYLVRGDVSSNTTAFTIATGSVVGLTSIPVAPQSFGVAAREIYRKNVTSGTTFLLVGTLNDNTTTTFVDNKLDSQLGIEAPLDQGQPPDWKYGKVHQERLFLWTPVDPGFIYYTEEGNPFVVKALNFQKVGDADGEIVRGLGVHANSISAYKDTVPWLIYMEDADPSNWIPLRTNGRFGAFSHYAIVDYDEGLQMVIGRSLEGAVAFSALKGAAVSPSRTNLSMVSIVNDSKSDKIEPDVFLFNRAALELAAGIKFQNRLWFSVPVSSSTRNNRVYIYDYARRDEKKTEGAWWPQTGLDIARFTIHDGKLYGGSSIANGFVYRLDVPGTYSDDGSAINSYFWTKEFQTYKKHVRNTKDFRFLKLTFETLGNWPMGVSYRTDADSGAGTRQEYSMDPGGSQWGSLVWGVGNWGGGVRRKEEQVELDGATGTRIQFKFDNGNTAGRAFKALEATLFYNLRGVR